MAAAVSSHEDFFLLFNALIGNCERDPSLLYQPEMECFKTYLESLGATLPPPPTSGKKKKKKKKKNAKKENNPARSGNGSDADIPDLVDRPQKSSEEFVFEDAIDLQQQRMGNRNKQTSEKDKEQAQKHKMQGLACLKTQKLPDALSHFTQAILLNPQSALLYATRGSVFLKMKRPTAAILDCDEALRINADSAKPYKIRGLAYSVLGMWQEAARDMDIAQQLDFDPELNNKLKAIKTKLKSGNGSKKGSDASAAGVPRPAGSEDANVEMPDIDIGGARVVIGGLGPLPPDLVNRLQDPKVMSAIQEMQLNPGSAMKFMEDDEVGPVLQRLMKAMHAGGYYATP